METINGFTIKAIIDDIVDIPTLPTVVSEILGLVDDPDSSTQDISNIIVKDPSLTSKVLKIVNSAAYGFVKEISTINHALTILGYKNIKSIVLGVTVFGMFNHNSSADFDREAFWKHNLAVASATRIIAKKLKYKDTEEAFTAGLMHDIGKIVIDEFMPKIFKKVINLVKEKNIWIYEAEREILSSDHSIIGGYLANKWNLPEVLYQAIRYHHSIPPEFKEQNSDFKIPAMVHVSDIIVRNMKIGFAGDDTVPKGLKDYFLLLNLNEEIITEIYENLKDESSKAEVYLQFRRTEAEEKKILPLEEAIKQHIKKALNLHKWNLILTAKALKVPLPTLKQLIKKYKLEMEGG